MYMYVYMNKHLMYMYRTFEQDPVGRIEFFSAHIMSLITLITNAEKQPYPLR